MEEDFTEYLLQIVLCLVVRKRTVFRAFSVVRMSEMEFRLLRYYYGSEYMEKEVKNFK